MYLDACMHALYRHVMCSATSNIEWVYSKKSQVISSDPRMLVDNDPSTSHWTGRHGLDLHVNQHCVVFVQMS